MSIFKRDKRTKLEKEIDSVLEAMSSLDPCTNEYTTMANNLVRLKEAQAKEAVSHFDWTPVISGGIALVQILAVLNYEKLDVISSKAFGFVGRGRV